MKYTKEQMEKRIMNYLMKTSKHLFLDEQGKFFKVMVTKVNAEEWVYITARFNGDKCDVKVKPITVSEKYYYEDLAYLQDTIFPKWESRKSIPYFKEAREKMFEILKSVRKHYDGSKESLVIINKESADIVDGMEFKTPVE